MLATHHLALHEDKVEPSPKTDPRMFNGERRLNHGPLGLGTGFGAALAFQKLWDLAAEVGWKCC